MRAASSANTPALIFLKLHSASIPLTFRWPSCSVPEPLGSSPSNRQRAGLNTKMTRSSFEKLQKFFKLEAERGFDNRAVVGGLDKILPSWEKEARASALSEETIRMVIDQL